MPDELWELEARLAALGALKPIAASEILPEGEVATEEPEDAQGERAVSIDSLVKMRLLVAFARAERPQRPGDKVLCTISDGDGGVWFGTGRNAQRALAAAAEKLRKEK